LSEKLKNWKYEDGRIYCVDERGELIAEVTYVQKDNKEIDIDHVYINPVLRGKGLAKKTMLVVSDYLRKEGLKATATCSYANKWFKRNKALYSHINSEDLDNQALTCKIDAKH